MARVALSTDRTPQDAAEQRQHLAHLDEQYVRRSYRRCVDPVIVRYRRLLRDAW